VNNHVWTNRFYTGQELGPSTNVDLVMMKIFEFLQEAILIPTRITERAKELGSHVVVYSIRIPAIETEIFYNL
jgi:hypothetical protein